MTHNAMRQKASALALASALLLLQGCAVVTPQNAVVASGVCWLDECELFYPTKVSVPDYYDAIDVRQSYQVGRNYYMDELACMNNHARCDTEASTQQLIYKRHLRPYITSD